MPTLPQILAYKFYLEIKTKNMSFKDLHDITTLMEQHAYNSQLGEKKEDKK